ncbi:hypothetical protein F441_00099 [Phytophthora nicotianae CJ01A1]|uniref:Uncharacterized protein n=2 Tax=Phytophthora nicotianae TaxID=4792 RepID=W2XXG4_PHYNI|nr:hypothetical protein L915_00095 [Phytophthora nicotianae]ETP27391.1 hypothetical protein F441_00099 [Phytophthora nicotianae CJ01A1]
MANASLIVTPIHTLGKGISKEVSRVDRRVRNVGTGDEDNETKTAKIL